MPSLPDQREVYSVAEFCHAYGVSRSMFYKLQKAGTGPRLCKVGRKTLVSARSASEWLASIEQGKAR